MNLPFRLEPGQEKFILLILVIVEPLVKLTLSRRVFITLIYGCVFMTVVAILLTLMMMGVVLMGRAEGLIMTDMDLLLLLTPMGLRLEHIT